MPHYYNFAREADTAHPTFLRTGTADLSPGACRIREGLEVCLSSSHQPCAHCQLFLYIFQLAGSTEIILAWYRFTGFAGG